MKLKANADYVKLSLELETTGDPIVDAKRRQVDMQH